MTIATTRRRTPSLADWLDSEPHPFSRAQILDTWSAWSLADAVSSGRVVRLLPGVYCGARNASDARVRSAAVCTWSARALVSGRAALHLYREGFESPSTIDVVLPYGSRVRAPDWVRVREQAPIRTWSAPGGVRCVLPERALLDAWHREPPSVGRDLVYRGLWQKVCSPGALTRALAAAPRVVRRRQLEALLGDFSAGATSPLEVMARREVFVGARFADFEWQGEVVVDGCRRRADLLHRRAGVAIEFDGRRYHGAAEDQARDRRRDAEFAAAGITTLRFTFDELRARPEWCRDVVLRAVAARL